MSAAARLAAFAAILGVLFAGGTLAGGAIDPGGSRPAAGGHGGGGGGVHGAEGNHGEAAQTVRGLAAAEGGLRLVPARTELRRGRVERLRFAIRDARGDAVRDFDVEHERRMHVILVRRDLTGFQHLHPRQGRDGAWEVAVRVGAPGSYRLFADFTTRGTRRTLATDLRVDGPADLRALPAPAAPAVSDGGHDVRLDAGRARPGAETALRFAISSAGAAVQPQPYLGARGHLVALREGDLAFLHVHPSAGDEAVFAATFPTPGRYRLFLQFRDGDRVHTAAFTQEVG